MDVVLVSLLLILNRFQTFPCGYIDGFDQVMLPGKYYWQYFCPLKVAEIFLEFFKNVFDIFDKHSMDHKRSVVGGDKIFQIKSLLNFCIVTTLKSTSHCMVLISFQI